MLKKIIFPMLKGALVVIYLLIFGEMFLRIFAPVPLLPRYICATDFGIRGNLPNFSYWHKTAEYKINIRTNSKGIRADREIPYEKPTGVKRIVVLGDSFGMGYEVSLEDSFLSVLERTLNHAGKNVEVVNLSVSGHGNAEELIMLQKEGIKYSPDVVLLAWQTTDLNDNVRSNLFEIKDGKLATKSKEYLPAVKTREFLYHFPVYIWLENDSHLYTWIREEAAALTKEIMVRVNAIKIVGKKRDNQNADKKVFYEDVLTVFLLNEIRNESEKAGAKFVIFDIPQANLKSFLPSAVYDPRVNLNVINVIPEMEKYREERLFWDRSHWHFTPRACGIAGRYIAQYILENRLL